MKSSPSTWKRISDHLIDVVSAEFTFSDRLARENDWSINKAQRAIEEYKRFIYLCAVSTKELTPSDEVDQVWHLHLAYTRDYWGPFAEAVGKKIHHGPTTGGENERQRYISNYAETLKLYEQEFATKPPPDIWPDEKIRFGSAMDFRRVDTSANLILPKPLALLCIIVTCLLAVWILIEIFDITSGVIFGFVVVFYGIYKLLLPKEFREKFRKKFGIKKNSSSDGCGGGGGCGGCGG